MLMAFVFAEFKENQRETFRCECKLESANHRPKAWICNELQSHVQKPFKHQFCKNCLRLKTFNYLRKRFYLWCLTGFYKDSLKKGDLLSEFILLKRFSLGGIFLEPAILRKLRIWSYLFKKIPTGKLHFLCNNRSLSCMICVFRNLRRNLNFEQFVTVSWLMILLNVKLIKQKVKFPCFKKYSLRKVSTFPKWYNYARVKLDQVL